MRAVVFTKEPLPGTVKTRLVPVLGEQGAADLHAAMVGDVLDNARLAGLEVLVSLQGRPGWFDAPHQPQVEGDLGARMAHALRPGPVLALGTDSPTLPPELLRTSERSGEPPKGENPVRPAIAVAERYG